MSIIAPTITAETAEKFQAQLDKVLPFAERLHVDFMDGQFAPVMSVLPDEIELPTDIPVDLHIMYQNPLVDLDDFIILKPQLVIIHAESDGDFVEIAERLHAEHIKVGVALLQETPIEDIVPALDMIDHVLVFSGNLGHQGGSRADPNLLPKVARLKKMKPELEIGWDGGINERNIAALAKIGVDVLNVGGFIQNNPEPTEAYHRLSGLLSGRQ